MGKRILSGAVVMVLAVAAILAGGTILAAVLFVISCTAYRELCKATGVHNKKGMDALETIGYGGIFLYYFLLWQKAAGYNLIGEKGIQFLLFMLPIGILMLMMAAYVLTFPKYRSEQVMAAFFLSDLRSRYVIFYISDGEAALWQIYRMDDIYQLLGV